MELVLKRNLEILKKKHEYKIRLIGSQISIDRFYLDKDPISVIEELIKISNPKLDEKIIFVWPEGMFPSISQDELSKYEWLFDKKFSENHILIIGTNSKSTKNGFTNFLIHYQFMIMN